jgi:hypothetical protein
MYSAINKQQYWPVYNSKLTVERKVEESCCDKEFRLHNTAVSICTPLTILSQPPCETFIALNFNLSTESCLLTTII